VDLAGRETVGDFRGMRFMDQIETVAEDLQTHFWREDAHVVANSFGAYLFLNAQSLMPAFPGKVLLLSPIVGERGGRAKLNTPISGRAAPMGEDRARVFRSTEDEQTTTPEPLSGIQGQGGHRGFGR
jgi:alpha-beta hydrolase superfamily lysophospholipase